MRAYVAIEALGIDPFEPGRDALAKIRIRNVGKVMARNVHWWVNAKISPDEWEKEFTPLKPIEGDNALAPSMGNG